MLLLSFLLLDQRFNCRNVNAPKYINSEVNKRMNRNLIVFSKVPLVQKLHGRNIHTAKFSTLIINLDNAKKTENETNT